MIEIDTLKLWKNEAEMQIEDLKTIAHSMGGWNYTDDAEYKACEKILRLIAEIETLEDM